MSHPNQYIFGYGSLVESQSRARTSPAALYAFPANVAGIKRGWFDQVGGVSLSCTYLGAVRDPNFNCNGVIFQVSQQQLDAFDQRETGYNRERIDQKDITMLNGSQSAPDGDVWFYANKTKRYASQECPIVQSYVDICLNGCLELEATYPMAKQAAFAETFLKTCSDWTKYWVNDRIYPRRAFIYVPNASKIDQLILTVLGKDVFSSIQIEPASWEHSESALSSSTKQ